MLPAMSGTPKSSLLRNALAALMVFVTACASTRVIPVLSPRARGVRVEKGEPPPGASPVGQIEATDGKGCGIGGDLGTDEGATFLMKEAAARRGIDFVKVTKVKKPYSGHDCYHQEYTIQGVGYALPKVVPAPAPAQAPVAVSAPPAVIAPAAPVVVAPDCNPPCSPGYACERGVCLALCNPPCAEGMSCRSDRVCVPTAK